MSLTNTAIQSMNIKKTETLKLKDLEMWTWDVNVEVAVKDDSRITHRRPPRKHGLRP